MVGSPVPDVRWGPTVRDSGLRLVPEPTNRALQERNEREPHVTPVLEDDLKVVYHLRGEPGPVTTQRLAEALSGDGAVQAPLLRNSVVTAFLYGMLLGPMALPCTGLLVISAFVLGVDDVGSLLDGLLYFVAFGFRIGWPLVALPLAAAPAQRQITQFLTPHHTAVERWSGVLLIIAVYGFSVDVLPNTS